MSSAVYVNNKGLVSTIGWIGSDGSPRVRELALNSNGDLYSHVFMAYGRPYHLVKPYIWDSDIPLSIVRFGDVGGKHILIRPNSHFGQNLIRSYPVGDAYVVAYIHRSSVFGSAVLRLILARLYADDSWEIITDHKSVLRRHHTGSDITYDAGRNRWLTGTYYGVPDNIVTAIGETHAGDVYYLDVRGDMLLTVRRDTIKMCLRICYISQSTHIAFADIPTIVDDQICTMMHGEFLSDNVVLITCTNAGSPEWRVYNLADGSSYVM